MTPWGCFTESDQATARKKNCYWGQDQAPMDLEQQLQLAVNLLSVDDCVDGEAQAIDNPVFKPDRNKEVSMLIYS